MREEPITGIVHAGHKQAALEVPFDPASRWHVAPIAIVPGRRGHPVRVVATGACFDSFVVARSKRWWLLLEEQHLAELGAAVASIVSVRIAPTHPARRFSPE